MNKIKLIDMSSVKPTADDYLRKYKNFKKTFNDDGLDDLLEIVDNRLSSLVRRFENDFLNIETYNRNPRRYSHDTFIMNIKYFMDNETILSVEKIPIIVEHIKICEDIFCEVYYGEQIKMNF